ncbi:MAG: protocatechuate 3,4-dioxygenase subunit beta [Acidobacteria bacterium SCN 69-37]|nr:MAG: protocatechuate 3,4-dioxygenase subunit beta [Acidobacteria bacterium SCN 69-37]
MTDRKPDVLKSQPPLLYPPYASTRLRAPQQPLIQLPARYSDLTQPVYGHLPLRPSDSDLTRQCPGGEPQGERIIVTGRVVDEDGRPQPNVLIEVWQANAAGRYRHVVDTHPAPIDPYFLGAGRAETDSDGRYRFTTIKPGAYPWRNHPNAWRPAHIHFSIFGRSFQTRLVTQMYFPGDPLQPFDPMLLSLPSDRARERLISKFDLDITQPEWALGYVFDIVLRGDNATPWEERA